MFVDADDLCHMDMVKSIANKMQSEKVEYVIAGFTRVRLIISACGALLIGIGVTYVTSQVSNRIMAVLPSIYDFAVFSVTDFTHEKKGTIVGDSESLIERVNYNFSRNI